MPRTLCRCAGAVNLEERSEVLVNNIDQITVELVSDATDDVRALIG